MKPALEREPLKVPLKIDGVFVGMVTLDGKDTIHIEITAATTRSYLKELMLVDLVDGFSLDPEYTGEAPENLIPFPRNHLRIARES